MVSHYAYRLDKTGRRTVVTEHNGRTTTYCHDELYRLKAEPVFNTAAALTEGCLIPAQRTGASYTADYQYDWTGNRTYETVDGVQTAYSYDMNDRLLQTGGTVYGYDDNGNTVSETLDGNTTTYQYNGKNQLTQTSKAGITSTYTYNPNGKTESGITTRFIVDENRDYAQVLEEITSGTVTTTYSYGHDLISQDKNGATSFYHYDGLGSTRALSDAAGALTDTYDYEAFGEVLNQAGSTENSYLFTGEQFDAGLNQYYLRARYYNQAIGRFTQMDTWMGNNHDPISLHKYLYVASGPVTYVDPTGNFFAGGFFSPGFSVGVSTASAVGVSQLSIALLTRVALATAVGTAGTYVAANIATKQMIEKCIRSNNSGKNACRPDINIFVIGDDNYEVGGHIASAQSGGKPTFVRRQNPPPSRSWLGKHKGAGKACSDGPGADCDEYPFTANVEGGANGDVSLRSVNCSQNRSVGSHLRWFHRRCEVKPNDRYKVVPASGVEITGYVCKK